MAISHQQVLGVFPLGAALLLAGCSKATVSRYQPGPLAEPVPQIFVVLPVFFELPSGANSWDSRQTSFTVEETAELDEAEARIVERLSPALPQTAVISPRSSETLLWEAAGDSMTPTATGFPKLAMQLANEFHADGVVVCSVSGLEFVEGEKGFWQTDIPETTGRVELSLYQPNGRVAWTLVADTKKIFTLGRTPKFVDFVDFAIKEMVPEIERIYQAPN